jgi:chromosome segregation ATPase
MPTDYENNNRVNTTWEKTARVISVGLLMILSYQSGLARGRGDKTMGQYTALKAQYDRILAEYPTLKAQYARIETEYAECKARYERTGNQYSALKAQYDRIEAQRTGTTISKPNQ